MRRIATFGLFLLSLLLVQDVHAAKPRCGDGKCSGGETSTSCPLDCVATSCGDGTCSADESYDTCPADCEAPAVCGDGVCGADETCGSCELDCKVCPPCNNDGVCNFGEDCLSCPGDCAGKTGGKPSQRYCCGLDTCDDRCGPDCGITGTECGNGSVEPGEECDDGNNVDDDLCSNLCTWVTTSSTVPANQFNIGDSIGEGEAADGTLSEAHHETVWSTGYAAGDYVNSVNERFEFEDGAVYYENNALRDDIFNHALSGAVMADFPAQAAEVVASAGGAPTGGAGMIAMLLGNNDVCADTLEEMTSPLLFEQQYRAGLDILAGNAATRDADIHVSGIPAIYWLWNAKRTDLMCRILIWPFVPCQNLLENPVDDCASTASREAPDVIYGGDGPNCVRRKQFHARIRDEFNPILRDVLAEYRNNGALPNASYVDVFDVRFDSSHVNNGDCFHPSESGHALLAEKQWCRSKWGEGDPLCSP